MTKYLYGQWIIRFATKKNNKLARKKLKLYRSRARTKTSEKFTKIEKKNNQNQSQQIHTETGLFYREVTAILPI